MKRVSPNHPLDDLLHYGTVAKLWLGRGRSPHRPHMSSWIGLSLHLLILSVYPPSVDRGGAKWGQGPSGKASIPVGECLHFRRGVCNRKYAVPQRRFTYFCSREETFSYRNPKFSARFARCKVTPVSSIVPFHVGRKHKFCTFTLANNM